VAAKNFLQCRLGVCTSVSASRPCQGTARPNLMVTRTLMPPSREGWPDIAVAPSGVVSWNDGGLGENRHEGTAPNRPGPVCRRSGVSTRCDALEEAIADMAAMGSLISLRRLDVKDDDSSCWCSYRPSARIRARCSRKLRRGGDAGQRVKCREMGLSGSSSGVSGERRIFDSRAFSSGKQLRLADVCVGGRARPSAPPIDLTSDSQAAVKRKGSPAGPRLRSFRKGA